MKLGSNLEARQLGQQMAATIGKGMVLLQGVLESHPDAFTNDEFATWIKTERARLTKLPLADQHATIISDVAAALNERIPKTL